MNPIPCRASWAPLAVAASLLSAGCATLPAAPLPPQTEKPQRAEKADIPFRASGPWVLTILTGDGKIGFFRVPSAAACEQQRTDMRTMNANLGPISMHCGPDFES